MRRISSVDSSGPNPGIAFGSVKSQAFSDSPTKSRIAGSDVHTRRSAARVSSTGTPSRRNAVTSVSALIDSSGGRGAGSNAGVAGVFATAAGAASVAFGGATVFTASASRLRRDQRFRKSSSVIVVTVAAARQRLGVLAVALTLEELPLDMVLGNESRHDLADRFRHRDLLDQIGGAFGKALAFGRIGRDGDELIGRIALGPGHHDPEARRAAREIVAVI